MALLLWVLGTLGALFSSGVLGMIWWNARQDRRQEAREKAAGGPLRLAPPRYDGPRGRG